MDIKANAKRHWRSLLLPEMHSMEVPEWGDVDQPAVIWFRNVFTGEERMRIAKASEEHGDKGMLMEIVIMAARHEDGRRIFAATDRKEMLTLYDFGVVERIGTDILLRMSEVPTVDDAKGN